MSKKFDLAAYVTRQYNFKKNDNLKKLKVKYDSKHKSEVVQLKSQAKQLKKAFTGYVDSYINDASKQDRSIAISKNDPFVITFVGRFKTGKSSLINSIIGYELLPTRATTATAVVTKIIHGPRKRAWVNNGDSRYEVTFEQAKDMILNYQVTDTDDAAEVIFELPVEWLPENVELRDTPGMDDSAQDGKLETVAMNSLKDTDLCICVYDAGAFPSGKERARTAEIYKMLNGSVAYVINCINHLNSREGLSLVETTAKNIFNSVKYSIPGMGRYFKVCSCPDPNLQYLDDFDKWIRNIADNKNSNMQAMIRENASNGRRIAFAEKHMELFTNYGQEIDNMLNIIEEKHSELHKGLCDELSQEARDFIYELKTNAANLENKLVNLDELEGQIRSIGNDQDYANECKHMTILCISNNYHDICNMMDFLPVQYMGITDTIEGMEFPKRHYVTVNASANEKVGATMTGAAIGGGAALLTGGAAIPLLLLGAFLGRIAASDETVDDSVKNTMEFINGTVVPAVRDTFREFINKLSDLIMRSVSTMTNDDKGTYIKTGLEDLISQFRELRSDLEKNLSDLNEIYNNVKHMSDLIKK